MLDCSGAKISEQELKFNMKFWQLRTPLSRHRIARTYGLDNGCFTEFKIKTWMRMLDEAREEKPKFVCLPDIVGDARRTLELFDHFKPKTKGLPRALVLQDGIGNFNIPWDELDAVFVGGSDAFKISPECINACKSAKILGKWVHVGRVNTPARLDNWLGFGDSLDGSGISKYDHMLKELVHMLWVGSNQSELFNDH